MKPSLLLLTIFLELSSTYTSPPEKEPNKKQKVKITDKPHRKYINAVFIKGMSVERAMKETSKKIVIMVGGAWSLYPSTNQLNIWNRTPVDSTIDEYGNPKPQILLWYTSSRKHTGNILKNGLRFLFGYHFVRDVVKIYHDLTRLYKTGDSVFLMGYSRGTVMSVALQNFIDRVGLLPPESISFMENKRKIIPTDFFANLKKSREKNRTFIAKHKSRTDMVIKLMLLVDPVFDSFCGGKIINLYGGFTVASIVQSVHSLHALDEVERIHAGHGLRPQKGNSVTDINSVWMVGDHRTIEFELEDNKDWKGRSCHIRRDKISSKETWAIRIRKFTGISATALAYQRDILESKGVKFNHFHDSVSEYPTIETMNPIYGDLLSVPHFVPKNEKNYVTNNYQRLRTKIWDGIGDAAMAVIQAIHDPWRNEARPVLRCVGQPDYPVIKLHQSVVDRMIFSLENYIPSPFVDCLQENIPQWCTSPTSMVRIISDTEYDKYRKQRALVLENSFMMNIIQVQRWQWIYSLPMGDDRPLPLKIEFDLKFDLMSEKLLELKNNYDWFEVDSADYRILRPVWAIPEVYDADGKLLSEKMKRKRESIVNKLKKSTKSIYRYKTSVIDQQDIVPIELNDWRIGYLDTLPKPQHTYSFFLRFGKDDKTQVLRFHLRLPKKFDELDTSFSFEKDQDIQLMSFLSKVEDRKEELAIPLTAIYSNGYRDLNEKARLVYNYIQETPDAFFVEHACFIPIFDQENRTAQLRNCARLNREFSSIKQWYCPSTFSE